MLKEKEIVSERTECTGCGRKRNINGKLIANMRDLNHIMRALYEGKASQKRILILLKEAESITQRDLTMRLGIQPGSASEILSKLENAGLIQRTISEADRRTANISLTAQGIQTALQAAEERGRRHDEMFSCLSESEKEELLTLLERLNEDWRNRYKEAEEHRGGRHHKHEFEHRHEGGHGQEHRRGHGAHRLEVEGLTHGEIH